MTNILLCGGNGTRLWPLSRELMPKQFLKLFDEESLFQKSIKRNSKVCENSIIVSNIEHYFIASDQLEEIEEPLAPTESRFLLEEIGKNTAPAILFAALTILESRDDDILFVTPSDHLIKDLDNYYKAIARGKELAEVGYLVTFGISPTEPHTGYGYIEADGEDVLNFHEKPDIESAKRYLEQGNFYWNSGMFIFKASSYIEEVKRYAPELYNSVVESYNKRKVIDNQIRLKEMRDIPDISVDYAVMERSEKIKVVLANFDWSDVGSFDSLAEETTSAEAIEIDSSNNFYYSDNREKVLSTIGIDNLIVVDTRDALLLVKKGESQRVKEVVKSLKELGNSEILTSHSIVHRPWGTFETLISAQGYKIKRIIVKPSKRLSLQKHLHRSEHWVVVKGVATVTIEDKTFELNENESTYIEPEQLHRLANYRDTPLVVIEVQVGDYTGEDDIIREEDDFERD